MKKNAEKTSLYHSPAYIIKIFYETPGLLKNLRTYTHSIIEFEIYVILWDFNYLVVLIEWERWILYRGEFDRNAGVNNPEKNFDRGIS